MLGQILKLLATSAAVALAMNTTASAVVIDGNAQVGEQWEAEWNYPSGTTFESGSEEWTLTENISASAVLTLDAYDSTNEKFTFSLALTNDSENASLTAWGFNTKPTGPVFELTGQPASGNWQEHSASDLGNCASNGSQCFGGQVATGILPSETGAFAFMLTFADLTPDGQFELLDTLVRFQGVNGACVTVGADCLFGEGSEEGSGDDEFSLKLLPSLQLRTRLLEPPGEIPVPASLSLVLLGLGALGGVAARRRARG